MKRFYFIESSDIFGFSKNEAMKLPVKVTSENCDSYNARSSKVKATKKNIRLLKKFCVENNSDYTLCEYDCTGSSRSQYRVRIRSGKCWITEHTSYDV